MRNLIKLLLLGAVIVSCNASAEALLTPEESVARVKVEVEKDKMVKKPQCVDYHYKGRYDNDQLLDLVDIVERHNAECGGDPDTAPRIFSVVIDRSGYHAMISDINDTIDGQFDFIPDTLNAADRKKYGVDKK
jgi:hypothetical protein